MREFFQFILNIRGDSKRSTKERPSQIVASFTNPAQNAQNRNRNEPLPKNLPKEIWLEIGSYLNPKELLNLTEVNSKLRKTITSEEDLYYGSLLNYFSDNLVSDEVIANVAGDSRIKFKNNYERFLFLKANLIDPLLQDVILYNDPNKGEDEIKLYSGCFANRDYLNILMQLNCWKLISSEVLKKYTAESLIGFSLSAAKYQYLSVFVKIIETLDYDHLERIFVKIYNEMFRKMYMMEYFHIEALQILVTEAKKKKTGLSVFSMNPLALAVFHNNNAELEAVLSSNEIDKDVVREYELEYSFGISRTIKAFFLQYAVRTRQYQKLKQLLLQFYGILDEQTLAKHIVLCCEEGDIEAVKIILNTFPQYAISEKFIGLILLELAKNEVGRFSQTCFEYLLLNFQTHASGTAKKDFSSAFISLHNSATRPIVTYYYVRVLKVILSILGNTFFDQTLNPLYIKILTEYSNTYWDNQDILADAKIQQSTLPSLLLVVASGNTAALKWMLKKQVDINERYISHNGVFYVDRTINLLGFVIENKLITLETRLDMLEQLLDAGIDTTNVLDSRFSKWDALALSIRFSEAEIVKKICRHPKTQCSAHWFDLMKAAFETNDLIIVEEVAKLFPGTKMSDVHNVYDGETDSAILPHMLNKANGHDRQYDFVYRAVRFGRLDDLKILLDYGADLHKGYKIHLYGSYDRVEIHNVLSLALDRNFFNITEFLIQQGAEIIPTRWDILKYENLDNTEVSWPIFMLLEKKQFRLLVLALDEIKNSTHNKHLSLLCNSYFDNPRSENAYIPTLGISIVYVAITCNPLVALVERLIDDLKINLSHPYIDKDHNEGPSLLHKLIDDFSHDQDFRDNFISVFSILVKKGANPFQIYKGQSVFIRLAQFGLCLSSGIIKNYTSQQLNVLFLEHVKFLSDPSFALSHESIKKNLYTICSCKRFNLSLSKTSPAQYISMMKDVLRSNLSLSPEKIFKKIYGHDEVQMLYYTLAYDLPCDVTRFYNLLTSMQFNPSAIINMHPQNDNASKEKFVLSLLKVMDKVFADSDVSVNVVTMRFINSCKRPNAKINKNPISSGQNENSISSQNEIDRIAEKLSYRCSSKNLQSPVTSFQPNYDSQKPDAVEQLINRSLFLRQR